MLRISVIIPTFNRKTIIDQAIDSVINQTIKPLEIIVIDDGSTDGTVEHLQDRYPQIIVIRQEHRGVGAARNLGIKMAKGDWIAFHDSDDIWLPSKLHVQSEILKMHPELGLLATKRVLNKSLHSIKPTSYKLKYYSFFRFLKRSNVNTPTIIASKEALYAAGLFDEALLVSSDWDMWARVAYKYPVARIETAFAAVFEQNDSISLNYLTKYLTAIRVISKWNPKLPDTLDSQHKISKANYQRFAFSFTVIRLFRLLRHEGRAAALDFFVHVEAQLGLIRPLRFLIKIFLLPFSGK